MRKNNEYWSTPSMEYKHKQVHPAGMFSEFRTVKSGKSLIRLGKNKKTGKWETHSVLTPK